ncbi:MAG: hypothetical protein U1U88_000649 [Lawsonella clevelandensis]
MRNLPLRVVKLIPWPNRIADAQFLFQETPVSLEMSEPALRNAIHGLATAALWDVSEKAADGSFVTLSFRSGPNSGQWMAVGILRRGAL